MDEASAVAPNPAIKPIIDANRATIHPRNVVGMVALGITGAFPMPATLSLAGAC
jgi:hypothetical protein